MSSFNFTNVTQTISEFETAVVASVAYLKSTATTSTLINNSTWKLLISIPYALQRTTTLPVNINETIDTTAGTTSLNFNIGSCNSSIITNILNLINTCITYDALYITPVLTTPPPNIPTLTNGTAQLLPKVTASIISINNFKLPNKIFSNTYNTNSYLYTDLLVTLAGGYTHDFIFNTTNSITTSTVNFSQIFYSPSSTSYRIITSQNSTTNNVLTITDSINVTIQKGLLSGQTSFTTTEFLGSSQEQMDDNLSSATITIGSCMQSYLIVQDSINRTLNIYIQPTNTISSETYLTSTNTLYIYEGPNVVIEIIYYL